MFIVEEWLYQASFALTDVIENRWIYSNNNNTITII